MYLIQSQLIVWTKLGFSSIIRNQKDNWLWKQVIKHSMKATVTDNVRNLGTFPNRKSTLGYPLCKFIAEDPLEAEIFDA